MCDGSADAVAILASVGRCVARAHIVGGLLAASLRRPNARARSLVNHRPSVGRNRRGAPVALTPPAVVPQKQIWQPVRVRVHILQFMICYAWLRTPRPRSDVCPRWRRTATWSRGI